MKKILILGSLLVCSVVALAQDIVVKPYRQLFINGGMTVVLEKGEADKIILVSGNVSDFTYENKGEVLQISSEKTGMKSNLSLKVVYSGVVSNIALMGAISFSHTGTMKAENLQIDCSGASNAVLNVETKALYPIISGSGNFSLSGTTQSVKCAITGSGRLDALKLPAERVGISVTGSGEAMIAVSQDLNVSITGSGKVMYKGNPKVTQSIIGSGVLKQM
jgi:hypothetical protein